MDRIPRDELERCITEDEFHRMLLKYVPDRPNLYDEWKRCADEDYLCDLADRIADGTATFCDFCNAVDSDDYPEWENYYYGNVFPIVDCLTQENINFQKEKLRRIL